MWMGFSPSALLSNPDRGVYPCPVAYLPDREPDGCLRGVDQLSPDEDCVTPVPALVGGREDEGVPALLLHLPGVCVCGPPGLVKPLGVVLFSIDDPLLPYPDPLRTRAPFHTSRLPRPGDSCYATVSRPLGRKAFLLAVRFRVLVSTRDLSYHPTGQP